MSNWLLKTALPSSPEVPDPLFPDPLFPDPLFFKSRARGKRQELIKYSAASLLPVPVIRCSLFPKIPKFCTSPNLKLISSRYSVLGILILYPKLTITYSFL
ncbi:MAG: hypothetical protein F6K50_18935 [Moorea sp. SIO3I7]|uniref:hypothetical protein n=1 Tax=Moorena sp. SIO3I8 TaxID=2607833 RepID=UPI0013C24AED|nr:hypothetical protein [Moorena sp. SIO3I8]NEN97524.1 hypothetical protein [Moorena sp. SIO3I7]NEO09227.1 hypothetical protein [Moorena sp. SIO3I8]